MKDQDYKTRLIQYCVQLLEQSQTETQQTMKDAEDEIANYGPPKDRYDGFRSQQTRRRNLFAKQLEQININLRWLESLNMTNAHSKVEAGALVVTDNMILFVSVGLGLIDFENEEVAVISAVVPVFKAMKDKKVGDDFTFNKKPYSILQIL